MSAVLPLRSDLHFILFSDTQFFVHYHFHHFRLHFLFIFVIFSFLCFFRDRFNRIHQIVFDLSFILLTPPVAFFIWQIAFRVNRNSISDDTQMHPPSSQTYPPSDLPSFSNNTLSSSNSTFSDITPINTTSSFPSSIGFSNSSLSLSFDPLSLSSMEDSSPIRTVVVEESENIGDLS